MARRRGRRKSRQPHPPHLVHDVERIGDRRPAQLRDAAGHDHPRVPERDRIAAPVGRRIETHRRAELEPDPRQRVAHPRATSRMNQPQTSDRSRGVAQGRSRVDSPRPARPTASPPDRGRAARRSLATPTCRRDRRSPRHTAPSRCASLATSRARGPPRATDRRARPNGRAAAPADADPSAIRTPPRRGRRAPRPSRCGRPTCPGVSPRAEPCCPARSWRTRRTGARRRAARARPRGGTAPRTAGGRTSANRPRSCRTG